MESLKEKKVLVSGASFAGLSTAYWMNKLGYKVTVVEIAKELRKGGTPVDIRENTVDIVKRMGIFEQIKSNRLNMEVMEFKNTDDVTEGSITLKKEGEQILVDECEIERDILLNILFDSLKNEVEFIFSDSITALNESREDIQVTFKNGSQRSFDLVFGCDGLHSTIRKIWFGHETEYMHFLQAYFSITIVNKSLIKQNTSQMYNVPGKAVMLNAYNNKTDIVLCFFSEKEITYDYRDEEQQRDIILKQFTGGTWRTPELLAEVQHSKTFYFDKLCQIKMLSWTKGRVALVGDAGYCASPAAGMGGSLAINGAAALADAFQKHNGDFELAFQDYNKNFRPFIEEIQEGAVKFGLEMLVPRTEEAIRERNTQTETF
ncbi:2-polyprenyl-6-methoxyphenol hydroxylase [Mucilaginibacter lappiensis]|uniref:2-polyprenyl-6-methoxyphenol hydroxylase-like FAD-dependent oxidoreductase n=1 Tax=Mucilaginibacter lappiensis TaxID=354630 RepID=A0ABR6PD54_9SPHI|nr:FAD-dependent monooxygenase [Mucilaginibacter lappiensis]MBB6107690.1 2-polyprenyl-6-methoxyphenol hydroxylase-like FAD-dependent oxidoreductase [Mucilaginibacter lappiensis]SIQ00279.1 2-polyprenyl-6-methoxyphenol hydroxylase [Mucilaginibacter lappiensis]